MAEYLAIEQCLPHVRPMLLLDRVVEATDNAIVCELVVRSDGLFDTAGRVPALLGIEYMAQCVAAYSGFHARRRGEPVRLGFLLGTRRFATNIDNFSCGQLIEVSAQRVVAGTDGMAAFDCSVTGEGIAQSARLAVYEPVDATPYIQRGKNR